MHLPLEHPLTTVFAKRPVAGEVKTRLTPPLDPEQAAALARAMLEDTLERHLAEPSYTTALAVAPVESQAWFRACFPHVSLVLAQQGETLGERLASWFEAQLEAAPSVVVVGADCPLLAPSTVRTAHDRLAAGADAIFAPDAGGGYALVGLAKPAPGLFLDVPMSRSDNFARTLDRAAELGLSVELLPEERDIDDESDLLALARELNTRRAAGAKADLPARTAALLRDFLLGSCA